MPDLPIGNSEATLKVTLLPDMTRFYNEVANSTSRIKPVNLRINGGDALGRFSKSAQEFNRSLEASNARVIAFSASAGALFAVVDAFNNIVKSTINVEKALTDLNIVFQVSAERLGEIGNQIFNIANRTGQSFEVASKAALEFARQGLTVEESLRRVNDALSLTRFTGLQLEDSILTITTALNAFDDAALTSTDVLEKISNIDLAFAASGKDLAQGLTRVGSIARDAGIEIDKLLGLITSAKVVSGRTGEVVGTGIGTIIQRISRPETRDQLRQLGVTVEDLNGNFLNADQILQSLARSWNSLTDAQQAAIGQLAGGIRQQNILRALMADLSKENGIFARSSLLSANASEVSAQRNEELNKTLSASLNELSNNLIKIGAGIGQLTFEPIFKRLVNQFNDFIDLTGKSEGLAGAGLEMGKGLLSGLGNYLQGPGLILVSTLVSKLFLSFAGYAKTAFTQILEVSSFRYKQEQAINSLLASQPSLYERIRTGSLSNLEIQNQIVAALQRQQLELAKISQAKQAVQSAIGTGTLSFVGGQVKLGNKNKAAGFVPEVTEKLGALQGGYQPGEVKQLNIPKIGQVFYNTAETVRKFPQFDQPAIMPPQDSKAGQNYKKEFMKRHGFNPYKNEGLIPNINKASGLIPSFSGYTANIPSNISDPFGRPPGTRKISGNELQKLEASIKKYQDEFRKGLRKVEDVGSAMDALSREFNLTTETANKIRTTRLLPVARTQRPVRGQSLSGLSSELSGNQLGFDFSERETRNINKSGKVSFGKIIGDQGELLPITSNADILTAQSRERFAAATQRFNAIKEPQVGFLEVQGLGKSIFKSGNRIASLNDLTEKYFESLSKGLKASSDAAVKMRDGLLANASKVIKNDKELETFKTKIAEGTAAYSSLGNDIRTERAREIREARKQRDQATATAKTIGSLSQQASGISGIFGVGKGGKAFGELQRISPEAARQVRDQQVNRALLASFVVPTLAGAAQSAISTETLGGRGTGQTIASAGNLFGTAATGFALGGPAGALGGLGLGLLLEVPRVVRAWTDTLPDLQKRLGELQDTTQRTSASIEEYISTSERLRAVNSGEIRGLTQGQVKELENNQRNALLGVSNLKDRQRIQTLVENNQFSEARQQFSLINQRNSQAENANKLSQNIKTLTSNIESEESIRARVRRDFPVGIQVIPDKTGGAPEVVRSPFSKESVEKIIQQRLNDPNRLKSIENLVAPTEQTALGLVNNNGKSLFDILLGNSNLTDKLSNAKQGEFGKSFSDLLSSLGEFDPGTITDIATAFTDLEKKLGPEALNRFRKTFSQAGLEEIDNTRKEFIVNSTKSANAIYTLNKALFESQQKFQELGVSIEKSAIKKLSDLTVSLRSSEISNSIQNQSALLTNDGDNLRNLFELREATLRNTNQATLQRQDLGSEITRSSFNSLSSLRNNLINDVKKSLETLFSGTPSIIKENIDKTIKVFNDDFEQINNKLRSGETFNEGDLEQIIQKTQNSLSIFEKFNKLGGIPADLQREINKPGALNSVSREEFTKNYLNTKLPNTFSSEEIDVISKIPTQDLTTLQNQARAAIDVYSNTLNELNNNLNNFKITSAKISSDLETNNRIALIQFNENAKLINKTFAVQQEIQRKQGELDVSVIARQAALTRNQQTLRPRQALQNQEESNLIGISGNLISGINSKRPGQFNFDVQEFESQLNNAVEIQKKKIEELNNLIGPVQNTSREQEQDTLKLLLDTQSKYNNEKIKQKQLTEDNLKNLKRELALSKDKFEIERRINEVNARDGNFAAINKNLGNTFLSGLDFGPKDFYSQLADETANFAKDFKQVFKDGFREAATGAKNLENAFRNIGLSISQNLVGKFSDLAIDQLFGLASTGARSLFNSPQKSASGGLIKRYARGGFVTQGSGIKDDVPALLTGGEFVINKKSTQQIGRETLEKLNNLTKPRRKTDQINFESGTGVEILLANEYYGNRVKRPTKGKFNISSIFSALGQTDENNPQNALKFSREKYFIELKRYQNQIKDARNKFEDQQKTSLYMAWLNAAISVGGQLGGNAIQNAQAKKTLNLATSTGTSANPYGFSLYSGSTATTFKYNSGAPYRAIGGLIPKRYANGGKVFGGDSIRDTVPAFLMGGEFVVQKPVVDKVGTNFFDYVNKTGKIPGFANGGYVGVPNTSYSQSKSYELNDMSKYLSELISVNQEIKNLLNKPNLSEVSQGSKNINGITIINNIEVMVSSNGEVTTQNSTNTSNNQGSENENQKNSDEQEKTKKIAELIKNIVTDSLVRESKNGGVLEQTFKKK